MDVVGDAVFQTSEEIFERVRLGSATGRVFRVRLSMYEIRKEHIVDLLAPDTSRSLPIVQHRALGAHVPELVELQATNVDELLLYMQQGLRVREALAKKVILSKSHCLIDIIVESGPAAPTSTPAAAPAPASKQPPSRTQQSTAAAAAKTSASTASNTDGYLSATLRFIELAGLAVDSLQTDPSCAGLYTLLETLATLPPPPTTDVTSSSISSSSSSSASSVAVNAAAAMTVYDKSCLTQLLRTTLGGTARTAVLALLAPVETDANTLVCTHVSISTTTHTIARTHIHTHTPIFTHTHDRTHMG
jgi:hypothetical protein